MKFHSDSDCLSYEGSFHNDCIEGKGLLQYRNGDSYTGAFKQNLKNGLGLYRHANGDELEGTWVEDRKDGFFTIKMGGKEETGNFVEDERDGRFETREGGRIYAEFWSKGRKDYARGTQIIDNVSQLPI